MANTFDVFYLGIGPSMDQVEGDFVSENAGALVGTTFGAPGAALANNIQTFSPGSTGFASGDAARYDTNNNGTNDTFQINGGANQVVDGLAIYNATITYIDGTTATITAAVMQDTAGRLYLMPETGINADQIKLEAQPIRSLTLNSVFSNNTSLDANRSVANYAVCFTENTAIQTPQGERLINDLRVGDLITTMDNGPQPIRWIGRRHLDQSALLGKRELRPVLIRKGLLGVRRDLIVSPQHGMLLGRDYLVRARHLARIPGSGVPVMAGRQSVTYLHLMFDAHQIVFAEGAPTESFYPGPMAQEMIDAVARKELSSLFPDICGPRANPGAVAQSYGVTARAFLAQKSLAAAIQGDMVF